MKRIRTAARPAKAIAAVASLALLAGCAGSVGGDGSGSEDSAGEGFAYDASQDEIDEALADLDPVTIKFQPSAMSNLPSNPTDLTTGCIPSPMLRRTGSLLPSSPTSSP